MVEKLDVGDLQRSVMRIVRAAVAERGWSVRRLSEEAGITRNRCNEVLRDARVATVDEIDAMCVALGLITWKVVRDAEREPQRPNADRVIHGPWGEVPDWADAIAARDVDE